MACPPASSLKLAFGGDGQLDEEKRRTVLPVFGISMFFPHKKEDGIGREMTHEGRAAAAREAPQA